MNPHEFYERTMRVKRISSATLETAPHIEWTVESFDGYKVYYRQRFTLNSVNRLNFMIEREMDATRKTLLLGVLEEMQAL